MSKEIIWVHGDSLSPTNPALETYPNSPAIFVWDDELLDAYNISLKRVVFLYESLLELPVTIRRGDVATEVLRFAAEHNANTVITTESPAPRFHTIARRINREIGKLRVHRLPAFVESGESIDLKRFSRYWRVAKKYAFDYTA